nr:retrovirus-related Pol polyprotein from transposon TNT 1-94 [Tanacetum cinerariifolium]
MLKEKEVHKFSDGTLTRVLHKLDHMVKHFRLFQYNPDMENIILFEDDKRGGPRNANHTQNLDLADIYRRFVYEDNLIQRNYSDTKKALITTPSNTTISTAFFSNNVIQDFKENYNDEVNERSSEEYLRDLDIEFYERALLNKGLVAGTFDWDEVSDDEEVTQVKVLMALADDELTIGKNHAHSGEWIDITMRKVNIILFMDEDADWQNYLKYINIDLKFVEEQRLNLPLKYNKIVFELNRCRDELLVLKQAKLNAVTFQIQNTELTGSGYRQKDKIKAKPDKTDHEMESVEKSKVNQSQQKSTQSKSKSKTQPRSKNC